MKLMRTSIGTGFGLVVLAGIALVTGGAALASHVTVSITTPDNVTAGQEMQIPVILRNGDGTAVPGAAVTFYLHASFGGVTGEAEIGRAVTDESGVATLTYRPRLAGHHEIRMAYLAPGDDEAQEAITAFDATGDAQLYRSQPAISIPGLNVGLLLAVVATVWTILFAVALRIVAIARAGDAGPGRSVE